MSYCFRAGALVAGCRVPALPAMGRVQTTVNRPFSVAARRCKMPGMLTALYLLTVVLLVFLNGFFVAAEFALVGVRRSRIETLAESGDKRARRLISVLDNLNAYLSASQLGITLASLGLGWIGEPPGAH